MMRPQVELAVESTAECRKLALRMKRRKTVSVTPAMDARMVAGAMRTLPIWTDCGIAAGSAARPETGVSQYLRMLGPDFYVRASLGNEGIDLINHFGRESKTLRCNFEGCLQITAHRFLHQN